jgi:hypothetical protein
MNMSKTLAGAGLLVALSAFGLTGALSLRAQVEPLYAVLRSIGAFLGVLLVTRWSAGVLDSLPTDQRPSRPPGRGDSDGPQTTGKNR